MLNAYPASSGLWRGLQCGCWKNYPNRPWTSERSGRSLSHHPSQQAPSVMLLSVVCYNEHDASWLFHYNGHGGTLLCSCVPSATASVGLCYTKHRGTSVMKNRLLFSAYQRLPYFGNRSMRPTMGTVPRSLQAVLLVAFAVSAVVALRPTPSSKRSPCPSGGGHGGVSMNSPA